MHSRIGYQADRAMQLSLQTTEIAVGIVVVHPHFGSQLLGVEGPAFATRIRPQRFRDHGHVQFHRRGTVKMMPGHGFVVAQGRQGPARVQRSIAQVNEVIAGT